jgi:Uma2 family endonuclease
MAVEALPRNEDCDVTRDERGTFDEVVSRLGNIPLTRIWKNPPPGMAKEADVLYADAHLNRLCELVDGVLVEKTMGYEESRLAMLLGRELQNYMDEADLGIVAGPDGMLTLAPGLVRIPDVSVVLWDSLPGGQMPAGPMPPVAPDIAIEVLSEGNTPAEMRRKVREYFDAGCRLVVLIDPHTRTTRQYVAAESYVTLSETDPLTCEPLLPGFRIPLKPLFDKAARRSKKPD